MHALLRVSCLFLAAGAIGYSQDRSAESQRPALVDDGPPHNAGQDLRLAHRSAVDETDQPYRLYVPPQYDGRTVFPLVVALHGTGGNENTLFDGRDGAIKSAAAEHGTLLLSPFGRGATEYKGIGENDVLCAIDDVSRRYRVDPDRIYLTGLSMGGQGAAYLALHHPDQFAAVAPLSSDCSFPWLSRNASHTPFLWMAGAEDHEHYLRGLLLGIDQMYKYGAQVKLEVLPGEKHGGPLKEYNRIFPWLLGHRRVAHPQVYHHAVETPLHGRAWWTRINKLVEPGNLAYVKAEAMGKNAVALRLSNISAVDLTPDPGIFDLDLPLTVTINQEVVATERLGSGNSLCLTNGPHDWRFAIRPAAPRQPTAYRQDPVASAPENVDMLGTEKQLANWITDAMRASTKADIALYSAVYYRGLPIPAGPVDIVDLIQCSRPFDEPLVTANLTGQELLVILEENLPDKRLDRTLEIDRPGASPIIQVSGMRYVFDLRKPSGQRIVESSLELNRTYSVAMEGQAVEYPTFRLGKLFRNLDYKTTGSPLTKALYGKAVRDGVIRTSFEGRVRDVSASRPE